MENSTEVVNEIDENELNQIEEGKRRVSSIVDKLQKTQEQSEKEPFSTTGFQGDSTSIEGHQIDIVDKKGKTAVYFKLTEDKWREILEETIPTLSEGTVSEGRFTFEKSRYGIDDLVDAGNLVAAESFDIQISDTTKISVSRGYIEAGNEFVHYLDGQEPVEMPDNKTHVFAMYGAVKIEVAGTDDPNQIAEELQSAFNLLQVPDALSEPSEEAQLQYKVNRLRWYYKLETDEDWEDFRREYQEKNGKDILDVVEIQEVFPGYHTVVEPGAHKRFLQEGRFVLTMNMRRGRNVHRIIKEGLISTDERSRRGIMVNGMSSKQDSRKGGSDSVFTRLRPLSGSISSGFDGTMPVNTLLIDPAILDRTDIYAYVTDSYGSTEPGRFEKRVTPLELIRKTTSGEALSGNEVMVRRGIPAEMITGILTGTYEERIRLLQRFRDADIDNVRGVPIEEFVKTFKNYRDYRRSLLGDSAEVINHQLNPADLGILPPDTSLQFFKDQTGSMHTNYEEILKKSDLKGLFKIYNKDANLPDKSTPE